MEENSNLIQKKTAGNGGEERRPMMSNGLSQEFPIRNGVVEVIVLLHNFSSAVMQQLTVVVDSMTSHALITLLRGRRNLICSINVLTRLCTVHAMTGEFRRPSIMAFQGCLVTAYPYLREICS